MITKNFVNQCEQAEEIQKDGSKIIDGDYYYWSVDKRIHMSFTEDFTREHGYVVHHPEQWDYLDDRKCIWLPTQEQLQEMVLPTLREKYNNSAPLRKMGGEGNWVIDLFCGCVNEDRLFHSNNMNELWLAFVMYEKYDKIWTGERWVKKGENCIREGGLIG